MSASTRAAAPAHPVQPGQVWASNHHQDKRYGERQHREVLAVWSLTDRMENVEFFAEVVTVKPDGTRLRPQMVRCSGRSIKGHRLVAEGQVS